jgi:predicted nuclease of predicted toxin-antitoxin system
LKFKLDENLDPRLVVIFEQAGHEASTVLSEAISGAPDETVFGVCQHEGRCLVTLDLDFSNPLRFPPAGTEGIVVLRPMRPVLPLIQATLASFLPALADRPVQGKLWIVEPGRIREYAQDAPEA